MVVLVQKTVLLIIIAHKTQKKSTVRIAEPQIISDLEGMNLKPNLLKTSQSTKPAEPSKAEADTNKSVKITLETLRQHLRKVADGKENLNLVIVGNIYD